MRVMGYGSIESFEGVVEDSKEVFGVGEMFLHLGGDSDRVWVSRWCIRKISLDSLTLLDEDDFRVGWFFQDGHEPAHQILSYTLLFSAFSTLLIHHYAPPLM